MTTPAWAVTARRVLHAAALCLGVASTAHGAGWQAAGSYTGARYQHTSTQLADGRVLLAGGRGSGVLASAMPAFRRAHPACAFSVHVTSPENVSGMVARGEVDIGMKFSMAPERGLHVVHQQPAPVKLVVAAGHALARRRSIRLRELADWPLALPLHGTTLRQVLDLRFQAEGLRLQGTFAGNLATLLPLVLQGEAVLFSSLISISVHVARHELAVLALPDLDLHPRLAQLLAHDDAPADSLKAGFCEHLAQAIVSLGR